jgi:heme/copper-type cytochrome/quinol oxidase subunit 2
LSTIALITTTVIMIVVAVIIAVTVALAVRATRRRRPKQTPDYWLATSRACELEWSASHRID